MSLNDFKYKQCIFYFSSKKEHLKFRADNIIIEDERKNIKLQHSCHRLFALFIVGNITVTSVLLKKASSFGFPVILLSRNFKIDAYFNNLAEGNFLLRKKQYMKSPSEKLLIAKQFVDQKINNQASAVIKIRKKAKIEQQALEKLKKIKPQTASDSKELLGMEGSASKIFFGAYFRQMNWARREPRTKRDIPNLLLDIGYTYLFNFIEAITALYGFDVYCGIYHTFFYQRKSLICDLVEPFRCIIDQRLRKAHNLGQIDQDDFFRKNNQFFLSYKNQPKYTKLFVKDILSRKEDIFLFLQQYYRWLMKDKDIKEFPVFNFNADREE